MAADLRSRVELVAFRGPRRVAIMAAVASDIAQYSNADVLQGDGFIEFARALSEVVAADLLTQSQAIRVEHEDPIQEPQQAQAQAVPPPGGVPMNSIRDFTIQRIQA